jgi:hypothetical protein
MVAATFSFVLISLPPQFNVSMSTEPSISTPPTRLRHIFILFTYSRGKGAIRNNGNRKRRAQRPHFEE